MQIPPRGTGLLLQDDIYREASRLLGYGRIHLTEKSFAGKMHALEEVR
jgi:hypothetical protein